MTLHILISNDDGCQAPGLKQLVKTFSDYATLDVAAPDRNRSGASNSLTLDRPLRIKLTAEGHRCIDGTPTDCVHTAITGLLDKEPDCVISGINDGPNMGDDVLYSGTVAAAMEGRFLGLPAIAVSMAKGGPEHFETGARVALDIMKKLESDGLPQSTILNINVPDLPYDELAGFHVTRLGHRHKAKPVIKQVDPRTDAPIYWIGPPGDAADAGPGTDFYAVSHGYVSITPIHVDLTCHQAIDPLKEMLGDMIS